MPPPVSRPPMPRAGAAAPRDRFLFWRTDFVGIAMMVSGILITLVNFGLVPASSFVLPRVLGILLIVGGLVFLFLTGAGGWMGWFMIPSGVLLTFGAVTLVLGSSVFVSPVSAIMTSAGMGMTFLAVFLVWRNHWWAMIASGAFVGLAAWVIVGMGFAVVGWHPVPVVLFLGLSFVAIWASSVQKRRMRWSLVTGSVVVLAAMLYMLGLLLARWIALWPIALVVAGLAVPLVALLADRRRARG